MVNAGPGFQGTPRSRQDAVGDTGGNFDGGKSLNAGDGQTPIVETEPGLERTRMPASGEVNLDDPSDTKSDPGAVATLTNAAGSLWNTAAGPADHLAGRTDEYVAGAEVDKTLSKAAGAGGLLDEKAGQGNSLITDLTGVTEKDLRNATRDVAQYNEQYEFSLGVTRFQAGPAMATFPTVNISKEESQNADSVKENVVEGVSKGLNPAGTVLGVEKTAEALDNPMVYARNPGETAESGVAVTREGVESTVASAKANPGEFAGAAAIGLAGTVASGVSALRSSGSLSRSLIDEFDPRVGPRGTTIETKVVRKAKNVAENPPSPGDLLPDDNRGQAGLGNLDLNSDTGTDSGPSGPSGPNGPSGPENTSGVSGGSGGFDSGRDGVGGGAGGPAASPGVDADTGTVTFGEGYEPPTPTVETDSSGLSGGDGGATVPSGTGLLGISLLEKAGTPETSTGGGRSIGQGGPATTGSGTGTTAPSSPPTVGPLSPPTVGGGVVPGFNGPTSPPGTNSPPGIDTGSPPGIDTGSPPDTDTPTVIDTDAPADTDTPPTIDTDAPPDTDTPPGLDTDAPLDRDPTDWDPTDTDPGDIDTGDTDPSDRDLPFGLPRFDDSDKKKESFGFGFQTGTLTYDIRNPLGF